MICAAIAFWVPIASMVMIAPLMSTSLRSSGIAVISLDFSAQATCPSDRPNSLAQTLTECKAPRPFLRSWLRRAVLPSTARMGCSTPVAAAAVARNEFSQFTKQSRKIAVLQCAWWPWTKPLRDGFMMLRPCRHQIPVANPFIM